MKLFFCILMAVTIVNIAQAQNNQEHSNHNSGPASLSEGKYYGEAQFPSMQPIALQADVFQIAPSHFTEFPNLEILLKLSLGGYNSHEYKVFHFKNLNYNFETGDLNLDEHSQDLILEAKVHSMRGRTHIEGQIFSRSSKASGTFNLLLESDEPPDEDEEEPTPFKTLPILWEPLLEGEYEGLCDNGKAALLQIQTAKDLHKDEISNPSVFGYGVYAQIATQELDELTKETFWSVKGSFAGGLYDLFSGNLNFIGPSTTTLECHRNGNTIHCNYEIQDKSISCSLSKSQNSERPLIKYSRNFRLNPTAEQTQDIPQAGQVSDEELALLLKGNYSGYLHHENSNHYQKVFLNIKTRVTTENPHNPNKVFITPTVTSEFTSTKNILSYQFEGKSFYLSSGFSLNGEESDAFIIISQWKKGYIQGIWYSKSFGRVGIVEFVKSETLPLLPSTAKSFGDWIGEYKSVDPIINDISSWLKVLVVSNPTFPNSNSIQFTGSYRKLLGLDILSPIEVGVVDPYSQRMNWVFKGHDGFALVSGDILSDDQLSLFWPASPFVFGAKLQNFKYKNYIKKTINKEYL